MSLSFSSAVLQGQIFRCQSKLKNSIYFLTLIILLNGCSENVDMDIKEPIRPVRTVITEIGQGFMWRSYNGAIQADLISKLSFRVGGVVEEVAVELGQKVEKGQVIAALNDNDLVLKLDQEKAKLLQANAEANNARLQYERATGLIEKGVVSQKEFETLDTEFRTRQAAVASAEKGVELAAKQLGYSTLRVPVKDCSVSELETELGENVSAGEVVATLNCGDHFEVLTHVSENVIRDINVGDVVVLRLNISRGEQYRGIVSEVGAAVGSHSTYPVVVRVLDPNNQLRVGMAAEVDLRVSTEQLRGSIVVPFSAVGEDSAGRFVYVFEAMPMSDDNSSQRVGVAKRVSVEIGIVTNEGLVIKSGIEAGQRIITAGLRYLTDGRVVKLLSDNLLDG